jgi:hypothetical protein
MPGVAEPSAGGVSKFDNEEEEFRLFEFVVNPDDVGTVEHGHSRGLVVERLPFLMRIFARP